MCVLCVCYVCVFYVCVVCVLCVTPSHTRIPKFLCVRAGVTHELSNAVCEGVMQRKCCMSASHTVFVR